MEYVNDDGTTTTLELRMASGFPGFPFDGGLVCFMKHGGSEERCLVFSRHAAALILKLSLDRTAMGVVPRKEESLEFVCVEGVISGNPSVTIMTKDEQRAVTVSSQERGVMSVVNLFFRSSPKQTVETQSGDRCGVEAQHRDPWLVATESIVVEVETLEQASRALVRYLPYLGILE